MVAPPRHHRWLPYLKVRFSKTAPSVTITRVRGCSTRNALS
jgi:hypothetical protein